MRASGILMPVFSLPSPHGVGTFGAHAYAFGDFLKKAGQRYWQLLPLGSTNYGDSPYQSFSAFAGNPYFIDLDMLVDEGLLTARETAACDFGDDEQRVDYGKLYRFRLPLLKQAFARFSPTAAYADFCETNAWWLDDYALFMALKDEAGEGCWINWDEPLRLRDEAALDLAKQRLSQEIAFYRFLQFVFDRQWQALKAYANRNGVHIIGDIPIYVAYDSADVWAHTEQFLLDKRGRPELVAGVPPDAFSEDGQRWGNPLYDWDYMQQQRYAWWKQRLRHAFYLYDEVRIDHFRGFDAYFAIPASADTAKDGWWCQGPGLALFEELNSEFGQRLSILAEALGILTE